VELSRRITQKTLKKFSIEKIFSAKKFFSVEKFFSRFGFEILIAPPCHPQNDFPYRRPCKTRFLYDKDPMYRLVKMIVRYNKFETELERKLNKLQYNEL